jgi:hypothetical protein
MGPSREQGPQTPSTVVEVAAPPQSKGLHWSLIESVPPLQ